MTKLKLQDSIYSPQSLKAINLEIRDYAKWFSHVSVKNKLSAKGKTDQPHLSTEAVEIIKSYTGDKPITSKVIDSIIEEIEDLQNSLPQITITLAAPASNGLKMTLVNWCRKNIDPNILVNFKFNSTILGGMVVGYKSHVYDWSFRRQILAERGKFVEVLRRV